MSELIFSSSFSTVIYHLLLDWWTPPAFTFMHHAARTMHSMLRVFYENSFDQNIYLLFKLQGKDPKQFNYVHAFSLWRIFFSNMCGLLRIYEFWLELYYKLKENKFWCKIIHLFEITDFVDIFSSTKYIYIESYPLSPNYIWSLIFLKLYLQNPFERNKWNINWCWKPHNKLLWSLLLYYSQHLILGPSM